MPQPGDPDRSSAPRSIKLDPRTLLAFVMVMVAFLGTVTALRAGIVERETALLGQELMQGRLLEMTQRHSILNDDVAHADLYARYHGLQIRGALLQARADSIRKSDPGSQAADWLDLQGQEEFAAARALRPFLWIVPAQSEQGEVSELNLQRQISMYLAGRGLLADRPEIQAAGGLVRSSGASVGDRRDSGEAEAITSIWSRLEERIREGNWRTPMLALGVVLFILALVIFTVADMLERDDRKWTFLQGGVVVALGAAVFVFAVDPGIWPLILGPGAFLALLVAFVARQRRRGAFSWADGARRPGEPLKSEVKTELHGGLAGDFPHHHEGSDGFSRAVIMAIAVTVFCSAVAGYWYSQAVAAAETAAHEALDHEVKVASRAAGLGNDMANLIRGVANELEQRARRSAQAQQAQRFATAATTDAGLKALALSQMMDGGGEDEGAAAPVERNASVADTIDTGEYGLGADPDFPLRLIRGWSDGHPKSNQWKPWAQWDAARGDSLAWHHKATVYLTVLTLFAVGLYLFGQGLSMGRVAAAYVLVLVAAAFVIAGAGWSLRARYTKDAAVSAIPETAAAAAEASATCGPAWRAGEVDGETQAAISFAAAQARLAIAERPEQYQYIIDQLHCVIALRPGFAEAYRVLADALGIMQSSEASATFMSLPSAGTMRTLTQAESEALSRLQASGRQRPQALLNSFAFDTLLTALVEKHPADVDRSVAILDEAAETIESGGNASVDDKLVVLLNRGLTLLAANRREEARRAYLDAAAAILRGLRSKEPTSQETVVAAFTDLETLLGKCRNILSPQQCDGVAQQVASTKELLVGTYNRSPAAYRMSRARLGEFSIEGEPSALSLTTTVGGFDPRRDRLFIVWYVRDHAWNSWRALQEVSGTVGMGGSWIPAGRPISIFAPFHRATGGQHCLRSGQYRAEAYVNGRFSGVQDYGYKSPNMWSTKFRALNLELCRPSEWQSWTGSDASKGGDLIEGFLTPAPSAEPAAFLFTFYAPRADSDAAARERDLAERAIQMLRDKKLLARPVAALRHDPSDGCPDQWSQDTVVYSAQTD
jgi:hypothetical protein